MSGFSAARKAAGGGFRRGPQSEHLLVTFVGSEIVDPKRSTGDKDVFVVQHARGGLGKAPGEQDRVRLGKYEKKEGQKERPSLYDLVDQMKELTVPTLVLTGDEDWPCLQPALLMKQTIRSAALSVMPNCGHTINIEDPDQFNRIVGDFIVQVDAGRWPMRDPRAMVASITGMK